jgi:hypothetical protein
MAILSSHLVAKQGVAEEEQEHPDAQRQHGKIEHSGLHSAVPAVSTDN